ncbi:MAG: hypothetical protein AABW49_04150 [Nanoarchaeota archaeon]
MDRKKISVIIIGLFFISIMIGSALNISNSNNNEEDIREFNGFEFKPIDNAWVTKVNNQDVIFSFLPSEVLDIELVDFSQFSKVSKIYFSTSPGSSLGNFARVKFNSFSSVYGINSKVFPACPADSELCKLNNYPVRNCDNADESTGVLVILDGNNTSNISLKDNCLYFEGSIENIVKILERSAYNLLGIIP